MLLSKLPVQKQDHPPKFLSLILVGRIQSTLRVAFSWGKPLVPGMMLLITCG